MNYKNLEQFFLLKVAISLTLSKHVRFDVTSFSSLFKFNHPLFNLITYPLKNSPLFLFGPTCFGRISESPVILSNMRRCDGTFFIGISTKRNDVIRTL